MDKLENAIYLAQPDNTVGIVLCHAYTGTPVDVKLLATVLHRAGYAVLCPQFSGHGTLDIYDVLDATPEMWWEDLQAAMSWMQARYPKLMVFGLSMGGVMAMKAMSALPNLMAGGVFNSPVVNREGLHLEERFMWYAEYLYQKRGIAAQFVHDAEDIRQKHRAQVTAIQDFALTFAPQLAMITAPIYVAQSGQDELIEPDAVYDLLDALEQAKVDFHWFPENTHVITTNRNRQAFEQSVLQFITQQTY